MSKKVWVVGGGRGRVRGLCMAAPRCVGAAFAAQTRAFGANTIKFRGEKWDEFGLAARAHEGARAELVLSGGSIRSLFLAKKALTRFDTSRRCLIIRTYVRGMSQ